MTIRLGICSIALTGFRDVSGPSNCTVYKDDSLRGLKAGGLDLRPKLILRSGDPVQLVKLEIYTFATRIFNLNQS